LSKVNRALLGGLLLGPVILALAYVHVLTYAMLLMIAVGICGGFFIVPLNALLQERGHETIGAGHALAVQNFVENIAMLLFVGGYSLASSAGVSVKVNMIVFGLILLVLVSALAMRRLKTHVTSVE
jgi:LPLT family lysophospholipid transporter-like MFS transporter